MVLISDVKVSKKFGIDITDTIIDTCSIKHLQFRKKFRIN